jgi:aminoglycoside phosphotransferase (APT) family kinase protein
MTTSDNAELAREICARCFGREALIEPLGGPNNAVFRLRFADGVHILKLARDTEARPLRKEYMLLELLSRYGIPVPHVEHSDLDAKTLGRPFLILANAGELRVADYLQVHTAQSQALCREMGELLGRIHTLVLSGSGDLQPEGYVPRDPAAYLQRLHALAGWVASQGLIDALEAEAFRALPMPDMSGTNLCHGDFHAVQCIVHEGRISAVVDWESAWSGNAAIDFAVTQVYLESYCPGDLLASFVTGYLSQRALPSGYQRDYLPVRMAQALALMRVMLTRGTPGYAARAVELFRAYLQSWNG